ncbi:hypothetical protein EHP00_365 [Ecytonucleospora hepatopenaei]|uniref:Uncharacterized protein n=1 Tax=Ecytonucleospora hepatopenaei TaxID=646526 RepID=A0A1W0E9B9_9MICR|nr:hypothetical protein EHP00_365 [Ecytonucleospora hepatopenaei]
MYEQIFESKELCNFSHDDLLTFIKKEITEFLGHLVEFECEIIDDSLIIKTKDKKILKKIASCIFLISTFENKPLYFN